ncbi:MAG: hypothetical protein L3J46_05445 [Kangiellaceae bacterium]|nr:hypothetical protein [Kangiellaceae bacterium]
MNLNEIQANIRLRSQWEAVDLGFAMVQTWWKAIYIPLAFLIFGIGIPLFFIVPEDEFWIAGVVFWWLKPLFDRLVLHIISHKLFNEELTSWQALKALPSLIWNTGFFQSMTFRRFSLSRGFNLPLWQLEQLRGEPRASRQRVLHIASHSQAIWLTIGLWMIELILSISLFALLFLFLPENLQRDFFANLFSNKVEYAVWLDILNYCFYLLVVTAVHPFYIAANFALYINRRTQLEAWDIELDFRKLASRLKQTSQHLIPALFAMFFSASLLFTPSPSYADSSTSAIETVKHDIETEFLNDTRLISEQSKDIIKEVMLTKNLDDKKITHRWIKKEKEEEKKDIDLDFWDNLKAILEPTAKVFGFIIEFGLWLLLAFGIILLIYFRDRWMYLFQGKRKSKDEYESPEVMFGMDIRPESLPENIAVEAQKLWQSGQHRESLSLLYRGALVHLINKEKIKLQNSHTEGDVVRVATKKLDETKQIYLKSLTTQWQLIAYAHRSPSEGDMKTLFDRWSRDFDIDTLDANVRNIQGDSDE